MSIKRNRALALASGLALVASGFASVPAVAASGDVTLKPSSGSNYGSFSDDSFSLENNVSSLITTKAVAYKVTTDEEIVKLTLKQGSTATTGVTIFGIDSLGNQVDLDSIDDTSDTSGAKVAGSNGIDADWSDSTGASGDELGTPTVSSGAFEIDLDSLGLAGFVVYQTSFSDTVVDAGTGATETLTVQPMKSAGTAYAYGDGSPEPITIQSWVEAEASPDYSTVDASYASDAVTLTWVDPKSVSVIPTIERFKSGSTLYLNGDDDSNAILAHSLRFISAGLNLDQVNLASWDYDVVQADGSALTAGSDENNDYSNSDAKIRAGLKSHDAAGKIYVAPTVAALNHDDTYKVIVNHDGDSAASTDFGSVGYTLPTSTVAYQIEATVDTSDKLAAQTSHTDLQTDVLVGTNARTWTAQLKSNDSTAVKTASVPVMAIVSYADNYAPGTLTVSGSSETISSKGGYTMVNGFTDSDGQFEVTVTSSSAVKAESYTVDFYVVAESTDKQRFVNTDTSGNNATHVATYKASDANNASLASANSVLSGDNVTASFSVTDNFGLPTNVDGTKAMQIELKATDTTDLKVYADVAADGSASFTFANYLGTGESDILTATLFTGTQTNQTTVDTALITLYNAADVAAVQVPATISTAITYDDFLTGGAKASSSAPAPNDGNVELKGTIVDANGAGIPGTAVTIAGEGLQFVEDGGSKYYTDSITVNTSAAGVFDIDVYSHVVNTTGVDVTISASGATATTTLKTYFPATGSDGLTGNTLSFSLDMPANIVMNKTYAVTATLTDKWGNAVSTKDKSSVSALSVLGTGSVQINSSDSATTKNFGSDGTVTVFLRSVKDIAGPGAIVASLQEANYTGGSLTGSDQALTIAEISTDVATTAWDETVFTNEISTNVEVYESESDIPSSSSSDTKVNAGSFKGYVAVYAKGHEGARLSAKIGNDWVIVPSLASNFERIVDFTGAGVDIAVRIYIDRVLIDTINLTTK